MRVMKLTLTLAILAVVAGGANAVTIDVADNFNVTKLYDTNTSIPAYRGLASDQNGTVYFLSGADYHSTNELYALTGAGATPTLLNADGNYVYTDIHFSGPGEGFIVEATENATGDFVVLRRNDANDDGTIAGPGEAFEVVRFSSDIEEATTIHGTDTIMAFGLDADMNLIFAYTESGVTEEYYAGGDWSFFRDEVLAAVGGLTPEVTSVALREVSAGEFEGPIVISTPGNELGAGIRYELRVRRSNRFNRAGNRYQLDVRRGFRIRNEPPAVENTVDETYVYGTETTLVAGSAVNPTTGDLEGVLATCQLNSPDGFELLRGTEAGTNVAVVDIAGNEGSESGGDVPFAGNRYEISIRRAYRVRSGVIPPVTIYRIELDPAVDNVDILASPAVGGSATIFAGTDYEIQITNNDVGTTRNSPFALVVTTHTTTPPLVSTGDLALQRWFDFQIAPDGTPHNLTITFSYDDQTDLPAGMVESDIQGSFKLDNLTWIAQGGVVDTGANTVTVTNVTDVAGSWSFGTTSVLTSVPSLSFFGFLLLSSGLGFLVWRKRELEA